MKRVFVFLLVGLLCFTMVSCSSVEKEKFNECVDKLRDSLYVPDSLIIYYAESYTDPEGEGIAYKITYNAKNRFGVYLEKETVYFVYSFEEDKINAWYDTRPVTFSYYEIKGGKHKVYIDLEE